MMSDFLISGQQKRADAKHAFGKAETEAYKVLEAQQKERASKGKVGKRSPGNDDVDEKAGDFEVGSLEWLENITPEELEKFFEENKKLDKALEKVQNTWRANTKEDKEGENTTTKKDESG
jgi:hypothetical protein